MLLPNAGKEWYNGVEVITLLKVFLVEDECVVREGLRDCIDWERFGLYFCGDSPDGELALPQIRKLRPDILITDIKMPFMDGLALSKLGGAELPETRIILISGHNDFEFAQEAIEIGVEQYLLKPVTKASLLKTLEDVSRKIDEEREQKDYLRRFQQEGPEYEQFARRKFFEQITSGTLRVSEIYEQAKKRSKNGGYDFSYAYKNIASTVEKADLATINQETIIAKSYEPSGYPLFNSPQEVGEEGKKIGVDVVNLANNHMLDKGAKVASQ